jgi:hypothetical protein
MIASSVYSCDQLSEGSYAIGTVSNGVFILTSKGKVKYHISQNRGVTIQVVCLKMLIKIFG